MEIKTRNPREFWDKEHEKGPSFEELATEKPSIAVVKVVDYLKEQNIPIRGKLLDIGCGTGRNSNWLAKQGFEVTGIDISPIAIKKATERAKALGLPVDYQTVNVSFEWPFADGSIDFIIDILTSQLFSLKELNSYTVELKRVLKPEGRFLLWSLDRTIDKEAQRLLKNIQDQKKILILSPELVLLREHLLPKRLHNSIHP